MTEEPLPLVSVLIPLYNHERYIIECLESIRNEEYPRLEVLILDDGSVDRSFETARNWIRSNSNRFEKISIEKQTNVGVAKSINYLIRTSNGEYIVPLGSDDKLIRGGILSRINHIKTREKTLAVFGDCLIIDEFSTKVSNSAIFDFRGSDPKGFRTKSDMAEELVMRWTIPGPVILFKRSAFFSKHGVGFYKEDGGIEDRDMFLKLLVNDQLDFISQKVSEYRIHTHNTCRPIEIKSRLNHYKLRYETEKMYINSFKGYCRLFLKLSTKRYALIVKRLERGQVRISLLELPVAVLMRGIYYSVWFVRRLRFPSNSN